MNYPFYRRVEYLDDGVNLYECLFCGEQIGVRDRWDPFYCHFCGIEFKGRVLDKRWDYISLPPIKKLSFEMEERIVWYNKDGTEMDRDQQTPSYEWHRCTQYYLNGDKKTIVNSKKELEKKRKKIKKNLI